MQNSVFDENQTFVLMSATVGAASFARKVGSVALISRDSDYFLLAKSVKDGVENVSKVFNITFDDDAKTDVTVYRKLFDFGESVKGIIAVGNADICNLARFFAEKNSLPIVVIPTNVSFLSVFGEKAVLFDDGVPKIFNCKKPEKIILDLPLLSGLKKQAFADAFCEVASKLVAIVDYAASCVVGGKSRDGLKRVFSVIESLTKIDEECDPRIKIINAEIKLGLCLETNSEWLYGGEYAVATVLSAMKTSSVFENAYFANNSLLKLYETFLICDLTKTQVSPNFNQKIRELGEVLNVGEFKISKNYLPLTFSQCVTARQKLVYGGILDLIKRCENLLDGLDAAYKIIYKGRQKRADFDIVELRRALRLAPYFNFSQMLKILNDVGVCECIE